MSDPLDQSESNETPIEVANRELREEQLPRLRSRDVAKSFVHDVLDLDLPILRTVVDLTIRPGKLCRDYINGYRRRYSNPLRYAFMTSALMALVYALIGTTPTAAIDHAMGMRPVRASINVETKDSPPDGARTNPEDDNTDDAESSSDKSADDAEARQDERVRKMQEYTIWMQDRMNENFNYLAFFMLPMIALFLWLFFRRERLNYAEHFAFVLFVWGQGFLLSAAVALTGLSDRLPVFVGMMVITIAYQIWAAVQFYAEGTIRTFLKMIAATFVHMIASGLIGMIVAIVMLILRLTVFDG